MENPIEHLDDFQKNLQRTLWNIFLPRCGKVIISPKTTETPVYISNRKRAFVETQSHFKRLSIAKKREKKAPSAPAIRKLEPRSIQIEWRPNLNRTFPPQLIANCGCKRRRRGWSRCGVKRYLYSAWAKGKNKVGLKTNRGTPHSAELLPSSFSRTLVEELLPSRGELCFKFSK